MQNKLPERHRDAAALLGNLTVVDISFAGGDAMPPAVPGFPLHDDQAARLDQEL